MRINGGKYRGKTLFSPRFEGVRPTSDRLREAVFNILRARLGCFSGKVFFDVFAGSGAVGLEAVSQGFEHIFFFDKNPDDAAKNIALFPNEAARLRVVRGDVCEIVPPAEKADVLFMDAPYGAGLTEKALAHLSGCLRNDAVCLIEVEKNELCRLPNAFVLEDERRYGAARLLIAHFKA